MPDEPIDNQHKPSQQQSDNRDPLLKNVKVHSPYKVYFDGPAKSISATNDTGPFDILPGHKNFMSLLSTGDITVVSAQNRQEKIPITSGIIHVSLDEVLVFLNV